MPPGGGAAAQSIQHPSQQPGSVSAGAPPQVGNCAVVGLFRALFSVIRALLVARRAEPVGGKACVCNGGFSTFTEGLGLGLGLVLLLLLRLRRDCGVAGTNAALAIGRWAFACGKATSSRSRRGGPRPSARRSATSPGTRARTFPTPSSTNPSNASFRCNALQRIAHATSAWECE